MKKILDWFKKNGIAITGIASVFIILGYSGFNLNIPEYYRNLEIEGKIIFVLIFNTLLTLILFSISMKNRKK